MIETPRPALVVLAAGAGTRMRSDTPKPLHAVGGASMLAHALATARALDPARLIVVTQDPEDAVARAARALDAGVAMAQQPGRRGTGDAARAALPALEGFDGPVLVTFADTPLIRAETLRAALDALTAGAGAAVVGFTPAAPGDYGRLVIDAAGDLDRIVEAADATPEERALRTCNAGPIGFHAVDGRRWLAALSDDNAQDELYLTELVALARAEGRRCAAVTARLDEALGVNSRADLAIAEAAFQARARAAAMAGGATLIAPDTVWLAHDTRLGRDVTIEPNVVFGLRVMVEDGARIAGFSHLEGCTVRAGAVVGPFARLRVGADIGPNARIGNFVEVKNADFGAGAKASHLAYIGDASIGAAANLGAGTITCNYDGAAKHRTEIGDHAFVGSNSALVAPVRIGAGAYVGSGSVITADVPEDALAIGRARQVTKPGLAARLRATLGMARRPPSGG